MRPQTTCKRADCLLIVGPLLMIATTDSESLSPGSNPGPAAYRSLANEDVLEKPGRSAGLLFCSRTCYASPVHEGLPPLNSGRRDPSPPTRAAALDAHEQYRVGVHEEFAFGVSTTLRSSGAA
jgi:hypothetical protein